MAFVADLQKTATSRRRYFDCVAAGIPRWDKFMLCCSETSLNSRLVDAEIAKAFVKERLLFQQRGEKVPDQILLNLDGSLF